MTYPGTTARTEPQCLSPLTGVAINDRPMAAALHALQRLSPQLASPAEAAAETAWYAAVAARLERLSERCLDALFIAAQSEKGRTGFAEDLKWCAGLCRATWNEEALWSGLVHVRRGPKARTHLMFAARHGDVERVRWLLARGAPVELRNANGVTSLMYASIGGSAEVIRVLLEAGANVNAVNISGWTALHQACFKGELQAVKVLLAFGASVNATTIKGWSPLHKAAEKGHVHIIRELLAENADTTLLNSAGATARQVLDQYRTPWPIA